jgi:hypothetical protein
LNINIYGIQPDEIGASEGGGHTPHRGMGDEYVSDISFFSGKNVLKVS